jgi:GNAT superfamily N-acetyltransferase
VIRERREEDLDRLCDVLEALTPSTPFLAGTDLREWLTHVDAERSWVFDMAPMSVAPTRNVVGHVQLYRPGGALADLAWSSEPAGEPVAIGKLFVRRDELAYGIARFLLKESVRLVRGRAGIPVLDLRENPFFPQAFYERFGFREVASGDRGGGLLIHPG